MPKFPAGAPQCAQGDSRDDQARRRSCPVIRYRHFLPNEYLYSVIALQRAFRFSDLNTETIGDRVRLMTHMPLAELVSDFDDQLKSATKGMASFSYEVEEYKKADVVRVDDRVVAVPPQGRQPRTRALE